MNNKKYQYTEIEKSLAFHKANQFIFKINHQMPLFSLYQLM